MAISAQVERFLADGGVDYQVIEHPAAYTSQEEAAAAHVSGHEWAKTVIFLKRDGEAIQAVLPASYAVDRERLEGLVGSGGLKLAEESEFVDLYPDCEPGAMPPLGVLYDQRVYVDERLTADESIVFDAGDHRSAVRMGYADYARLVDPVVGEFGIPVEQTSK